MKLLVCDKCSDMFKLTQATTFCKCGMTFGRYLEDGWHAEVSADAIVIGIANDTLYKAVSAFRSNNADSGYRTLSAWVMGHDAPRVKWLPRPTANG